MHFKDKVVWITGASSGIGAAVAKKLAADGAILIITARNIEALTAVRQVCLQYTAECFLLPADLLETDLGQLTEAALKCTGKIDIFISCAGVSQRALAIDTTMEVYRQLMEINFFVPAAITKSLLPYFRQHGGQIAVVSSMAGLMGFPMRTGYAAAKHALKGFFETLQTEDDTPGLSITIISPGRIQTPISLSALTGNGSSYNVMDKGQLNGIPVDVCADKIISGIRRKKKQVIIARGERILWWLWWFIPSLYYNIAAKKGNQ